MGETRRRWSSEFKLDAVALVRSSGRSIADVARELGCGESSLSYWLPRIVTFARRRIRSASRLKWPSRRRSSVCAAGWRNWRLNARS